jgi:hypothetical protein
MKFDWKHIIGYSVLMLLIVVPVFATSDRVDRILTDVHDSTTQTLGISITTGDIGGDITLENGEVVSNATDGVVEVQTVTALTNAVQGVLSIQHTTSGTPANGIGVGLDYEQETSASNNEIIMSLDAVVDDATGASEDASFSVKLMTAGAAAAEKFAVESTGVVTLVNAASLDNSTDGILTITEPTVAIAGAVDMAQCTIAADDTTPSMTGCFWMTTSANSGATAITDIDDAVVGSKVCIVGGSATNSSTVADSGNFNLSGAFTAGLDDILCLYIQADDDYIEVSVVDN